MKKWLISLIIIFLIGLVFVILFFKKEKKQIDLFNEYYHIENYIFDTVTVEELEELINNNVKGLLFVGNKDDIEIATTIYNTLDQYGIGLAYFLVESNDGNKFLEENIGVELTYPLLIGINDKEIVDYITDINEENIIPLMEEIYGSTMCTEDC